MNGQNGNSRRLFAIPTLYVGIGGYAKAVFPRLDALFQGHYGSRPDALPLCLFDFDEGNSEITLDGRTVSIKPYLTTLPKKPLMDVAKQLRRKGNGLPAYLEPFRGYVALDQVRAIEAPGLNLFVQSGNLAWRLLWESHVLPVITARIRQLHPDPHTRSAMERQGIQVSNRSVVWVLAGGGSTTGPTGLIPMLCELKALLPPETSLFGLVFTPRAYRDKTDQHRNKGRAIFRATMEQLLSLLEDQVFDQPYGTDGHRISLAGDPFDQLFLVDGTLNGGRQELKLEDLAELVAHFLYKTAVGATGERLLGIVGNLNRTGGQA